MFLVNIVKKIISETGGKETKPSIAITPKSDGVIILKSISKTIEPL